MSNFEWIYGEIKQNCFIYTTIVSTHARVTAAGSCQLSTFSMKITVIRFWQSKTLTIRKFCEELKFLVSFLLFLPISCINRDLISKRTQNMDVSSAHLGKPLPWRHSLVLNWAALSNYRNKNTFKTHNYWELLKYQTLES